MSKEWIQGEKVDAADLNMMVVPCGAVLPFAGSSIPSNWLLCDGSSLLRASYPSLFAAIGTTYGAADGTHFNLPNMKGKVPVGLDSSQTEFDALGETGGAKTHTLIIAEMPSHSHTGSQWNGGAGGSAVHAPSNGNTSGSIATDSTGGGVAHNNLQPYITLYYIIRY